MSPAERRAALSELEVVLCENGMRPSPGPMHRWKLLAVAVAAAVTVAVLPLASGGSSTGSAAALHVHVTPTRSPLGPTALGAASGCVNKDVVVRGGMDSDDQPRAQPQKIVAPDGMHNGQSGPTQPQAKAWHRLPRSAYPAHDAFDHPQDALRSVRSGRWNASAFPLLLCIGQGKTATKSLNKAFVMLGMQTAHFYGAGVYGLLFDNAAEATRHSFMFNVNEPKHVDAVLDTPVVDFYNEILLSYPRAWVVLTVRKTRSWIKSQQKFYSHYAQGCRKWMAPWRRGSNLVYGTECPSKEQALKRYVQHNRNVYDSVEPSRLLVMDMPGGDGWDKLCPFLTKAGLTQDCPPTNLTQCRKAGVTSCAFPNRK